ncbi:hypothetical protein [Sphaerisporangium sp. NPDC051011]|uniref:hypothetical protein n=1 Tax=Sphaerisporangium sp. NPDC051011 TaxID=3155792 RepID=UPI0033D280E9
MSKLKRIKFAPHLDPWERQPDESTRQHAQFVTFRDLGRTRTVRRTADKLQRADAWVRQVAAAFRWRERAEAYDKHLDQMYEATWIEERRKAAEVDAKILGAAVGKVAQRLTALDASTMSTGDLIRLIDVSMRHRRVLFGDPASAIVVSGLGGEEQDVQVRIAEQQGLILAEVIRRVADQLLLAVVDKVDDPRTTARLGREWPLLLSEIVPREIAAVVENDGD